MTLKVRFRKHNLSQHFFFNTFAMLPSSTKAFAFFGVFSAVVLRIRLCEVYFRFLGSRDGLKASKESLHCTEEEEAEA